VAASAEIRFLAPTRRGDVLVATATERERKGRDGVYDVTVTVGEKVVATFVGRSKEIDGTLW
jgi:acyl-CoA thioesterase